jgi:hypothetical protein
VINSLWCDHAYILFTLLEWKQRLVCIFWTSSVRVESRPWTGWPGFNFWQRQWWDFFLFTMSRLALGPTQPPIHWVQKALSIGVKWQGLEAYTHLHLMSRSRMHEAIPPLPQYTLMSWYLVKHRNNFTFTLPVFFFGNITLKVNTINILDHICIQT